jgi:hypothetical protein
MMHGTHVKLKFTNSKIRMFSTFQLFQQITQNPNTVPLILQVYPPNTKKKKNRHMHPFVTHRTRTRMCERI